MTVHRDWQGYRVDVPREEQCRKRCPGRGPGTWTNRYCDREKGHTGNHRSGPTQWGNERNEPWASGR